MMQMVGVLFRRACKDGRDQDACKHPATQTQPSTWGQTRQEGPHLKERVPFLACVHAIGESPVLTVA